MSKLMNFFFSFDKLMKESLVRAFFWLALINLAIAFTAQMLDAIELDWFAAVFEFVYFFARFLLAVVALRLIAELAIALFRINDNLSPDGGKSETANIDPIAEARHAAELAAKRAQDVTKSAVDRTSAATKSATERGKSAANDLKDSVSPKGKPQVTPVKKAAADDVVKPAKVKAVRVKKAPAKKTGAKKPVAKASAAKKSPVKKTPVKKTRTKTATSGLKRAPGMKLDGTPRKKPGPKKPS